MSTQEPIEKEPLYIDFKKAAKLTGWSYRQFRRVAEEDNLPFFKIGHKHFIVTANLRNFRKHEST